MGTKKTIGFYFYNPNRPTWAINLGGILQGLSFFFGLCGLGAFGMGFSFPPAFIGFAVFAALTIACQLGGRRLALGKKQTSNSSKADPATVELVSKLRERGVSDKDIVTAVRAVQSGESPDKVIKHLKTKAGKK